MRILCRLRLKKTKPILRQAQDFPSTEFILSVAERAQDEFYRAAIGFKSSLKCSDFVNYVVLRLLVRLKGCDAAGQR